MPRDPRLRARARRSAAERLTRARADLVAAERWRARATDTSERRRADRRVSECSAAVAGLEQWLHWIDHDESVRPEADGDWAPRPGRRHSDSGRSVQSR
jgi:hypothetical protein